MTCIGYTSGGSPIFFSGPAKTPRKTKGEKNTRYKCKDAACNARTTKNQLKLNGGVCFSCKTTIKGTTNG